MLYNAEIFNIRLTIPGYVDNPVLFETTSKQK